MTGRFLLTCAPMAKQPKRAQPTPAYLPRDAPLQGYLSSRWVRRDGDTYAIAARAAPPNSPIRGGDDSASMVYVPSGARRSGQA